MRRSLMAVALAGFMTVGWQAGAAPVGGAAQLDRQLEDLAVLQGVQYWQGRQYCWYDEGWRGPGWYRCGYAWRRGYGWGGARGWQNWRHPGWRDYEPGYRRDYRWRDDPGYRREYRWRDDPPRRWQGEPRPRWQQQPPPRQPQRQQPPPQTVHPGQKGAPSPDTPFSRRP